MITFTSAHPNGCPWGIRRLESVSRQSCGAPRWAPHGAELAGACRLPASLLSSQAPGDPCVDSFQMETHHLILETPSRACPTSLSSMTKGHRLASGTCCPGPSMDTRPCHPLRAFHFLTVHENPELRQNSCLPVRLKSHWEHTAHGRLSNTPSVKVASMWWQNQHAGASSADSAL